MPVLPRGDSGRTRDTTDARSFPAFRSCGASTAPIPLTIGGESLAAAGGTPAARGWRRSTVKRLRRWVAARLVALATAVLPRLYVAYMWLVEVTSRHDDRLTALLLATVERHDRAIAILWHQEVFTVAYNYRHYRGHALVSVSDFGQVIAAMLRRCNFTIVRGGSGSRSRKRAVLPLLVDHMRRHRRVIYGITVDGSRGPACQVKRGGPIVAHACRAPVIAVRTGYRRSITLPTWDRAQIPLPFNRRITLASGPYWIAPDADAEAIEHFRAHLQNELLELTERAHVTLGTQHGRNGRWGFPEGWRPGWAPAQVGRRHGPHDLDLDQPPPWAHRTTAATAEAKPIAHAGKNVYGPPPVVR